MKCKLFQWLITRKLDGGENLSRTVNKHLENCQDCRLFFNECRRMHAALKQQAGSLQEPGGQTPELHTGIMARIKAETASSATTKHAAVFSSIPSSPLLLKKVAVTVASIALIGGLVYLHKHLNSDIVTDDHERQLTFSQSRDFTKRLFSNEGTLSAGLYLDQNVDRTFSHEFRQLHKQASDSADFLVSCLNLETES